MNMILYYFLMSLNLETANADIFIFELLIIMYYISIFISMNYLENTGNKGTIWLKYDSLFDKDIMVLYITDP
jgi:hypothetical protein